MAESIDLDQAFAKICQKISDAEENIIQANAARDQGGNESMEENLKLLSSNLTELRSDVLVAWEGWRRNNIRAKG